MDKPQWGYWCECWTEDLDRQRGRRLPPRLASIDSYSAPQADRWVAVALRTITPALDFEASDEAWDWLYEGRIETRRALLRSEPCTVSITQDRIRVTWTIRPVLFVPLAHRNGARGTAGNHGESRPVRRLHDPRVCPGQRPAGPQMPAASQAESLAGQAPSELLSRAGRHGLLWSTTRAGS
jgi:hypothetical protein